MSNEVIIEIIGARGSVGPAGPQGDQGIQGIGWAPTFALLTDGARRVIQLSGWTGGTGTAPIDGVGSYIGPSGLTTVLASAVDIRGPAGIQGPAGAGGYSGTGVPGSALGPDGSFYFRTDTGYLYGPKTAGAWGSGFGISGPTGPGVAAGGTINQILYKTSGTDYATAWASVTTVLGYTPVNKAGDTMTGFLTLNADPTSALHPATKQYVDNAVQGLDAKQSVKAATTINITLSGTQSVDGIALVAGDRCLVKNQTTASANGIYLVASGAWTRALDADAWTEFPGAFVFVEQGSTQADTGWICISDLGGTLGTTSIAWTQFFGGGSYTAASGIVLTGIQFTLTGQALALHNLASNGIIVRTASGTVAARTIAAPSAGVTITNGDGIAGNPTINLVNDLAAIEALTTTGIVRRTATDTWAAGALTTLEVTTGLGFTPVNKAGDTITGLLTLSGGATGAFYRSLQLTPAATALDLSTTDFFYKTITANTTWTLSNIPSAGTLCSFNLHVYAGSTYTQTFWSGLIWVGNVAPTFGVGHHLMTFYTWDGGTTWFGSMVKFYT